jgi:ferredoxin
MPAKYVIGTETVPHRFEPVTRSGVIAWEEGCLKCAVCVKTLCIYQVYDHRGLNGYQMIDSIDNECMNCFRCVQSCPKELIHKSVNPEFKAMGDGYWTPDIIGRLWYQAETGKIPVSGAGYPGPFSGPGFDAMWTDMSEIVRPTRDGIHGREYISTAVDMGKKPACITFSEEGELDREMSGIINIPLPIMLRMPSFGSITHETVKGWAMAAKRLATLLAVPQERMGPDLGDFAENVIPILKENPLEGAGVYGKHPLVEIEAAAAAGASQEDSEKGGPGSLTVVTMPLEEGIEEKASELVRKGFSVLHIEGSRNGTFVDNPSLPLKDGIRAVHLKLIEENARDQVTLLASGGLAMPEHVAKAMICGADAVYVDFPFLIALECRMCGRCVKGLSCPVRVEEASPEWVARRSINLMGAWHNQLLEVMGAMGIRDARRLRGEAGRAMFFEDLDESTFGTLGELKEGYELE